MRLLLVSLFLVLGGASDIWAYETEWVQHDGMLKTRLIVSSTKTNNDEYLLAWEAKLAPGWKTYWRSPGEAGLPIKVSHNGHQIEVLYPFPKRFVLFGLETYGYGSQVITPFYIASDDQTIDVKVDFMVCKDICVPFTVDYKLDVANFDKSHHDIGTDAWLQKVPALSGDDGAGLDILKAKLVGKVGHQKVVVDAVAANANSHIEMLAEVNSMVHFGTPQKRLLADGKTTRFILSAQTGNSAFDLKGHDVRLSFSDGKGASIERTFKLQ